MPTEFERQLQALEEIESQLRSGREIAAETEAWRDTLRKELLAMMGIDPAELAFPPTSEGDAHFAEMLRIGKAQGVDAALQYLKDLPRLS